MNSWKEIAAFFDKDVRTVRRWEATRHLPVRRMPGGGRSGVYAYVAELGQWLTETDGRKAVMEPAGLETAGLEPGLEPAGLELDAEAEARVTEPIPDEVLGDGVLGDGAPEPGAVEAEPGGPTGGQESGALVPEPRLAARIAAPSRTPMAIYAVAVLVAVLAGTFLVHRLTQRDTAAQVPDPAGDKPSPNSEAQELYLRGHYLWDQRTEGSLTHAVDLYTQSIVHDPHFAAAYAGLADSYILLRQYGHMADGEAFPRALAASQQALKLDQNSPEAHRSYAFVLNYWMWNFPEADREFQRSIALRPNDAQTHSWYATSLYSVGRYQDAMREIDTARRLAPDSIAILANRGLLMIPVDQKGAVSYLLELEKANPSFANVHSYLADAYFAGGDLRNDLDERRRAGEMRGDEDELALIDQAEKELEAHGQEGLFRYEADEYAHWADAGRATAMKPASLYMRLGNQEKALHYLRMACDRHDSIFPMARVDATFAPLHGRPDFEALMARDAPMSLDDAMKENALAIKGFR